MKKRASLIYSAVFDLEPSAAVTLRDEANWKYPYYRDIRSTGNAVGIRTSGKVDPAIRPQLTTPRFDLIFSPLSSEEFQNAYVAFYDEELSEKTNSASTITFLGHVSIWYLPRLPQVRLIPGAKVDDSGVHQIGVTAISLKRDLTPEYRVNYSGEAVIGTLQNTQ